MRWALLAHGVTRFAMTIRPDNHPSQALASQLGFVRIGSHIDEVDGLEDILECRLSVEDITKEDSEKLRWSLSEEMIVKMPTVDELTLCCVGRSVRL